MKSSRKKCQNINGDYLRVPKLEMTFCSLCFLFYIFKFFHNYSYVKKTCIFQNDTGKGKVVIKELYSLILSKLLDKYTEWES